MAPEGGHHTLRGCFKIWSQRGWKELDVPSVLKMGFLTLYVKAVSVAHTLFRGGCQWGQGQVAVSTVSASEREREEGGDV